jgi:hypothetical protein
MKRRTFIKASTLPLWATVESSLTPFILASSQDQKRIQNIDVSVLNLNEISEKMVLSDPFDQRNIQIIGYGTSGRVIAQQLHTNYKDGIHDIRYNQESGDIEEVAAYEPNRLWIYGSFPPLAKADTGQRERLLNYTMDIDKPDTVIFVGDVDRTSDFNSISKGFELAQKRNVFTIGVITVPYESGQKEKHETRATLNKLEKHFDSLFVIPIKYRSEVVDSAPQKAIGSILEWYLASRPQYLRQFDLTDIKTVLMEGRADYRFYRIPEIDDPFDFVNNVIANDISISKLKNGLVHFHSNGSHAFEDVNKVLDLISEQVDMDGYWCFYCTSDTDSEKPSGISIISTG